MYTNHTVIEAKKYLVKKTSKDSAEIEDIQINLEDGGNTRKVIRAVVVNNANVPAASVKIKLVHQRRSNKVPYEDIQSKSFSELKAGESAHFQLDSETTFELFQVLSELYSVDLGAIRGRATILTSSDTGEVFTAEGNIAQLFKALLES